MQHSFKTINFTSKLEKINIFQLKNEDLFRIKLVKPTIQVPPLSAFKTVISQQDNGSSHL